jgi:hypothetical protein
MVFPCIALLVPAVAIAQIFECTNANGVKEFLTECPAGTVKQRQVTKGGTATPSSQNTPAPAAKSNQELEADYQRRQIEKKEAEAKAIDAKKVEEDNRWKCELALKQIANRPMIGQFDRSTGKWVYRDDTSSGDWADIGKAKLAAEQYCTKDQLNSGSSR